MRLYFFLLVAIVGVLSSCNEEITVGSAILEDTTIGVSFTDTLEIEVKTVVDDTVITYRSGVDSRTYLIGELNDPSFGFSKSDIYLSTQLISSSIPSFDTLTIDSIIMVFPLDTFGQFGNESAIHNIEVFQLQEELFVDDDNQILSSKSFEFGTSPVGQISTVINHRDSVFLELATNRDSLVKSFPQLRIPMDIDFWSPILTDTTVFTVNDSSYLQTVKGFVLRSSPDDSSIAGINLSNSSPLSIAIYYTNLDGSVTNNYLIDVGSVRSSNFMHDYTSSSVNDAIGEVNTEFAYLQSMQGVNLEVDLSNLTSLNETIINKAQLEFFLLDETDPLLDPVESLDVLFRNEEGNTIQILDSSITLADYLGGEIESIVIGGQTLRKYELDITNHAVLIARGEIENTVITIEAKNKPQRATRSILLGKSHSDFPARLKLVTSNP